jgi:hypothetical protein
MADLLYGELLFSATLGAIFSSRFLNIQSLRKVDVHFNSLKRIFQRKESQTLRLFIEALENPEILKIVRLPPSDLFSFKLFEKLRVSDHFTRPRRMLLSR